MTFFSFASLITFNLEIGEALTLSEKHDPEYAISVEKSNRVELEWWKTVSLISPKLSGQFTGARNNQEISFSPMDAIGIGDENPMFPTGDSSPVILLIILWSFNFSVR